MKASLVDTLLPPEHTNNATIAAMVVPTTQKRVRNKFDESRMNIQLAIDENIEEVQSRKHTRRRRTYNRVRKQNCKEDAIGGARSEVDGTIRPD